jgi:tetratricopeptide (TPR) repeat protein
MKLMSENLLAKAQNAVYEGKFATAIELYQRHLESSEPQVEVLVAMAELFEEMNESSKAVESYKKAAEISLDPSIFMKKARLREKLSRIRRTHDGLSSDQKFDFKSIEF